MSTVKRSRPSNTAHCGQLRQDRRYIALVQAIFLGRKMCQRAFHCLIARLMRVLRANVPHSPVTASRHDLTARDQIVVQV